LRYGVAPRDPAATDLALPRDFDAGMVKLIDRVRPFTMTSPERVKALWDAVLYVVRAQIPGSIVECGVWRGGSMMVAALALQSDRETDRDLYLFDTFQGMVEPGPHDLRHDDVHAADILSEPEIPGGTPWRAVSTLDEVQRNMRSVGYPDERIHYVEGRVEDTVPQEAPHEIAILRLDTDWYESTKHELVHLFPRIAPGGVLIIDDYDFWQGAKRAVDEYFRETAVPILLMRIDEEARLAVVGGRK
jgi:hypothetical protein